MINLTQKVNQDVHQHEKNRQFLIKPNHLSNGNSLLFQIFLQKTIAVRSGDYYLFEDLDEKVELDLLHERPSAGIDDAITDRKLSDKLTIEQVNRICSFVAWENQLHSISFHINHHQQMNNDSFLVVNKSQTQFNNQCTRIALASFLYLFKAPRSLLTKQNMVGVNIFIYCSNMRLFC